MPVFDTIFKADSTYYGPSWMLTYTFMGSILTLVLSSALREVGTRQKILILAGVAAVLIGMNSFYICLLLGNGICLLMRAVEKSMKERERKENLIKDGEGKYGIFGAALWIFSIWFVRKSFWIGTTLGAHGFTGWTRNHGILWSCCCIPDDFRLPSLLARRSGDLAPGDPQKNYSVDRRV
ncbi:MAG: hypothetical protein ACLR8P_01015 [Clostridium fessum]